jgi:alpha-tubulin suppressor-like RCC1 family protein
MWTFPGDATHLGYGTGPNVPDGLAAKVITAGEFHNVVIKSGGILAAWGGPHTHTATVGTAVIDAINNLHPEGFRAVSAGDEYTVALTTNGELVAWGQRTESGQTDVPSDASGFLAVSAGQYHAVAIKSDGHLIGWGQDYYGCAGGYNPNNSYRWGTFPDSHPPYKEVSCGYASTVAIRDDANSTIDAWGDDGSQLTSTPHEHGVHHLAQGQSFFYAAAILVANVCYANCDGSTSPPILNASDFSCFQQRFASGDTRADCDSDGALTAFDFECFNAYFTGGCP